MGLLFSSRIHRIPVFSRFLLKRAFLPNPHSVDVFTWADGSGRADDRDQVAFVLNLDSQDAETGFFNVEDSPINRAVEVFGYLIPSMIESVVLTVA